MSNIGREIKDFYCNGYAGRRYDLAYSKIEYEAHDYIILRIYDEPVMIHFSEGEDKQALIDEWCAEKLNEDDELF